MKQGQSPISMAENNENTSDANVRQESDTKLKKAKPCTKLQSPDSTSEDTGNSAGANTSLEIDTSGTKANSLTATKVQPSGKTSKRKPSIAKREPQMPAKKTKVSARKNQALSKRKSTKISAEKTKGSAQKNQALSKRKSTSNVGKKSTALKKKGKVSSNKIEKEVKEAMETKIGSAVEEKENIGSRRKASSLQTTTPNPLPAVERSAYDSLFEKHRKLLEDHHSLQKRHDKKTNDALSVDYIARLESKLEDLKSQLENASKRGMCREV